MKRTFNVSTTIEAFDGLGDLSEKDKALVLAAQQAVEGAYAPYSHFQVGAALRLVTGEIVIGNNQENMAYPSGLCAERVAVFAAAAMHPGVEIEAIAVAAHSAEFELKQPVTPCGACRQVLHEYETLQQPNIPVLLSAKTGEVWKVASVADLLPLTFHEEGLRKD